MAEHNSKQKQHTNTPDTGKKQGAKPGGKESPLWEVYDMAQNTPDMLNQKQIMQLQRSIGNQATGQLLRRQTATAPAPPAKKSSVTVATVVGDDAADGDMAMEADGDMAIQRDTATVKTKFGGGGSRRVFSSGGQEMGRLPGGSKIEVDLDNKATIEGNECVAIKEVISVASKGDAVQTADDFEGYFIKSKNIKVANPEDNAKVAEQLKSYDPEAEPELEAEPVKTNKVGDFGNMGTAKNMGMNAYTAKGGADAGTELATGTSVSDKLEEAASEKFSSALNAAGSKLSKALEGVASDSGNGGDPGVLDALAETLSNIFSEIGTVLGVVADFASVIGGAIFKVGKSFMDMRGKYKKWQTFNETAKTTFSYLVANEDENTDETSQLVKQKGVGKVATYAAGKTFRAFLTHIFRFTATVGQAISDIVSLFTAGAGQVAKLGITLVKAGEKALRWVKGIYKFAKGTRGENRALNANELVTMAQEKDEEALQLLLDLKLTNNTWMIKLAAKLGEVYMPGNPDDSFIDKKKNAAITAASKKATAKANKVKSASQGMGDDGLMGKAKGKLQDQFIENVDDKTKDILLTQPTTTEEMFHYLGALKTVDQFDDYSKAVAGSMASQ
ncbi:MAG: hypothetical protein AAFV33_04065 [Chloroflexota bacterium]